MNNSLSFSNSLSPKDFLKEAGASSLQIRKGENSGKLFFITNLPNISGKVSDNYKENPVVSQCTDLSTGETFLMLHKAQDFTKHELVEEFTV